MAQFFVGPKKVLKDWLVCFFIRLPAFPFGLSPWPELFLALIFLGFFNFFFIAFTRNGCRSHFPSLRKNDWNLPTLFPPAEIFSQVSPPPAAKNPSTSSFSSPPSQTLEGNLTRDPQEKSPFPVLGRFGFLPPSILFFYPTARGQRFPDGFEKLSPETQIPPLASQKLRLTFRTKTPPATFTPPLSVHFLGFTFLSAPPSAPANKTHPAHRFFLALLIRFFFYRRRNRNHFSQYGPCEMSALPSSGFEVVLRCLFPHRKPPKAVRAPDLKTFVFFFPSPCRSTLSKGLRIGPTGGAPFDFLRAIPWYPSGTSHFLRKFLDPLRKFPIQRSNRLVRRF